MISSIAFPDMLSSSRMNTVQDTSATKSNLRLLLLSNKNSLFGDPYFGTELKNVILFNKVQVPHYNYVGDSILGYKAHMGAGSITSNVKSDKKLVIVKNGDAKIETGLKKFGAMIGDNVEVGCGSILNPGSVIGKNTNIYPLTRVRGIINSNSILKDENVLVEKENR